MKMIYTVGHTESYEKDFKKHGSRKKKGRTFDYPGGSVWNTYSDAQKHCPSDYSVYGVMANWQTQTEPSCEGCDWNDLLVDADLVKLDGQQD